MSYTIALSGLKIHVHCPQYWVTCALKQILTLAWAIGKYMTLSQLLKLSELEF